ncbi:hypothetical protein PENFLA_c019G05951 [Penicillium flavigenum]|uniref:Uncharacterized protein n=1 Tax=Penicillium flavigenum TaxID=254877 RepID=A0A1V6SYP0_9EURO|nr:hypothetical protein PENFLA_c019G05951 [Penicillium flavigenum]
MHTKRPRYQCSCFKRSPQSNAHYHWTFRIRPSDTTDFNNHRLQQPPTSTTTDFNNHRLQQPPTSTTTDFNNHRLQQPPTSTTTDFNNHRLQHPRVFNTPKQTHSEINGFIITAWLTGWEIIYHLFKI